MVRCCPECKHPLEQKRHHGVEIDVCIRCKAAWFDPHELSKTLLGPAGRPTAYTAVFDEGSLRIAAISDGLQCPACPSSTLFRVVWGDVHAAGCSDCRGIWITAEGLGRLRSQIYEVSKGHPDRKAPESSPWKIGVEILLLVLEGLG
jgi:Zn-finger nucleic acid-binding protein